MNATKDIIRSLRDGAGLSQKELAEKVYVTRQAVSRWENGDTVPNTDTLKLLSKLFDVSVNTLLGSPRKLICQCCGMPLDDDGQISREPDGDFNEDYCKWCYTDGEFVYKSVGELTDFLVEHLSNENFPPEQARAFLKRSSRSLVIGKSRKIHRFDKALFRRALQKPFPLPNTSRASLTSCSHGNTKKHITGSFFGILT